MARRMLYTVIALFVVFGGIFGWNAVSSHFMNQYFANFQPPPESVAAAIADLQAWQPTLEAVGSIVAVNGVQVSTEVSGVVEKIGFESGQEVSKGHLLIQLDASTDEADLRGLFARLELARSNYKRAQTVFAKRLISESSLEQTRTELERAEADVAAKQAVIAKKAIRAPFAGRLGIRKVNLGQYVAPGTDLVPLQSLDPVYANFSLPAQGLSRLQTGQVVRVTLDSFPGRQFEGRITAIDSQVDDQTRNVMVQATLANADRALQPGMYAVVTVLLPQQDKVVTVPKTALSYSPYGDYVYLIQEEGGNPVLTVKQQYVVTGPQQGDNIAIVKGVNEGDRVVIAGQLKLRDGARVVIEDSVKPIPPPGNAP